MERDERLRRLLEMRVRQTEMDNVFSGSEYSYPSSRSLSDRERLEDPSLSGLDLSDDPRMSMLSVSDAENSSGMLPQADSNMSFLGPRMKIHSPAPWEADTIPGDDDPGAQSDGSTRTTATQASKRRPKYNFVRGLALGRSSHDDGSDDSGGSSSGRKSTDTLTHGAFHALAQASHSSLSLAREAAPRPHHLRQKISLGRMRHNRPPPPTPTLDIALCPTSLRSPPVSPARSHRSAPHDEPLSPHERHPFANPELSPIITTAPRFFPTLQAPSQPSQTPHSHTSSPPRKTPLERTVSAPLSPSSSAGSRIAPALTPDSSNSSVPSAGSSPGMDRLRTARRSGVERHLISSPIQVAYPGGDSNFTPVDDTPSKLDAPWAGGAPVQSPTFGLISLAEAQAQARARSLSAASGPWPELAASDQPDLTEVRRTRARSTSIGIRLKKAASPSPAFRSPAPPTPTGSNFLDGPPAKGKKGFMRLFRDKTPAASHNIPPSPALPAFSEATPPATPVDGPGSADFGHDSTTAANRLASLTRRVPVPALHLDEPTPPMDGAEFGAASAVPPSPRSEYSGESGQTTGPLDNATASLPRPNPHRERKPPRKRTPPALHLEPLNVTAPGRFDGLSPPDAQLGAMPQSAPAETSGFEGFRGLSLRPVSTVFSAHFADHIVPDLPDVPQSAVVVTPASAASTLVSASPAVANSHVHGKEKGLDVVTHGSSGSGSGTSEDSGQDALIRQLREQVRSTRKAWQTQIWELEAQVRELRGEVEDLRSVGAKGGGGGACEACGRGEATGGGSVASRTSAMQDAELGVINRPRARTSGARSGRFGSGGV